MDIKEVGKYLKTKRIEKGYTQGELADILNVSHQAVSRWEKGDNLPDVFKLSELAKLYNVSMEEILQQDEFVKMNQKEESKTIATLSIVSVVFSFLITVLFFSILVSSLSNGAKILILYVLMILNILLYVLPFALKKTTTTKKDLHYLYLGSFGTVFTFFMTIVAVGDGAFGFSDYYVYEGLFLSVLALLVHYVVFGIINSKLFGTSQNKFIQAITSIDQSRLRQGSTSLGIAIIILVLFYLFTGYVEFMVFTIGILSACSIIILLIRNFNMFSLGIGLIYFVPFGFMIFYMTNASVMTLTTWTENSEISMYYEDSIGIIVIIFLTIFIILRWLYKEYFHKYATTIYLTSSFFMLQVFSILFASPTYSHIRETNNDFVTNYYYFDFKLIRASIFQIILFAILITVFRQMYRDYKTWSLNKAD